VIDCNCIFEHLTSAPPGDTPAGFVMLGRSMDAAARDRNPAELRPELIAALNACRTNGTR
jgi:hypothetical protein